MNHDRAVCPRCLKEVNFKQDAGYNWCPECGAQYPVTPPRIEHGAARSSTLGLFVKVILIMVGLVVVFLFVAFAGCALLIGGSRL
jgi:hypothetical protein